MGGQGGVASGWNMGSMGSRTNSRAPSVCGSEGGAGESGVGLRPTSRPCSPGKTACAANLWYDTGGARM